MPDELELDELYREVILDHYRNPRNRQEVPDPHLKAEGFNPFCGDQVEVTARLDRDGHLEVVGITGQGCAISLASASMMGEAIKDHGLEEAEALVRRFRELMHGKAPTPEEEEALGEILALEGVRKFPIRIKCALLAWVALQDAIDEYRKAAQHPKGASDS